MPNKKSILGSVLILALFLTSCNNHSTSIIPTISSNATPTNIQSENASSTENIPYIIHVNKNDYDHLQLTEKGKEVFSIFINDLKKKIKLINF